MRRTSGALSICDCETPYLLKGKYRENGNSSAAWVYNFIVVVISRICFLISSIFLSIWNSRSTFLSFLRIGFLIFSASNFPVNFDYSSWSLIFYCGEPVISDNFLKSSLGFPMGRQRAPTAVDVCNEFNWGEIAHIFSLYGNDPWAWKIMDAIVHSHPLRATVDLVQMVLEVIPKFAKKRRQMVIMATLARAFHVLRAVVSEEYIALGRRCWGWPSPSWGEVWGSWWKDIIARRIGLRSYPWGTGPSDRPWRPLVKRRGDTEVKVETNFRAVGTSLCTEKGYGIICSFGHHLKQLKEWTLCLMMR